MFMKEKHADLTRDMELLNVKIAKYEEDIEDAEYKEENTEKLESELDKAKAEYELLDIMYDNLRNEVLQGKGLIEDAEKLLGETRKKAKMM